MVERYAFETLTPGLIVDNKIKDIEQVATSLERAVKRAGFKAQRAAICVTANNVISKVVAVESDLSEDEMESLVEIEADKIVPYALDEVNIDFIPLGKSMSSTGEEEVQIVVCRKKCYRRSGLCFGSCKY